MPDMHGHEVFVDFKMATEKARLALRELSRVFSHMKRAEWSRRARRWDVIKHHRRRR